MTIQIDSREHKKELERITKQFDECGVKYFISKLYVADYMSLDNPRLVIDRKKDLQELISCVCQGHQRFRRELTRAIDAGIKIVILVEHGIDIKTLEDVYFYKNPRKHEYIWRTVDGRRVKEVISAKAVDGNQLYKSLCTIKERYNVDFQFCSREETGNRIVEILRNK